MDRSNIQHKISKYTAKLQNAPTSEKSEVYQRKLSYYNTLQSGGAFENLKGNVREAVTNIAKIKDTIANIGVDQISGLKNDVIAAQGKFNALLSDSIELGATTKKISREVRTLSDASDELRSRIGDEVEGVKAEIKKLGVPELFELMVDLGVNSMDFLDIAKSTTDGSDISAHLADLKKTVADLVDKQSTMKPFEKADIKSEVTKYNQSADDVARGNSTVAAQVTAFKKVLDPLTKL